MENFPFSEKRLASMPTARGHKWVTAWLQKNYSEVLENRFNDRSLDRFFEKYMKVRSWLEEPVDSLKKPASYKKWLEFISERFHEHRKLSGKGLAESNFLPKISRGDRVFKGSWKPEIPYRVALDHIRSAFNVGSIIRVIDSVGFDAVMLSENTPGRENRQVQKTAMGCTKWIPLKKYRRLPAALNRAKAKGYSVFGIETIADSSSYFEFPWPEKGIVVLGNEEYGISEDILKVCDDFVHLPMKGFKNSVNVANAFAVIAFHIASIRTSIRK